MPSYLDFNSTGGFRNFLIGRTLQQPNGPQTFTSNTYSVQNLSTFSNVDPGSVDTNRTTDLLVPQSSNVFKPLQYLIKDTIETFPRRANLSLYPYFTYTKHNIIGILGNEDTSTESELYKFAANNIKTNPQGPVYARIAQNLEAATNGKNRLLDALNGNTATAINLLTGREPLIEYNNKITVAKTLPGKVIDFVETVVGVTMPFSEIPGDYLSNPANPINYRPQSKTLLGEVFQDITGVLGSLIGIERRPKLSRKPSDLFIEYMGEGQKQDLFNNLSFSRYAPNYTTSARSQQSSKIFSFVDNVAQGVKNLLGLEAPSGEAYIGDDRGNDVKFSMSDFNDRPIRSNFYLSLMFDEVQARLFHSGRNITQGGKISGPLTWISAKSKNKLGINNAEYNDEASALEETLSTQYGFRDGSILGTTQQILDTMPKDGGAARSHVANVIDQTSRIFREGDTMMSRGSAIKYTDKFGEESGAEFCRVWTKDRSYFNLSDTMKRTGIIRKFDGSVMGGESRPWNINYAPMSNGNKSFEGSTNIFEKTPGAKDFYAKKYMFSIENLAWKASTLPGFTVQDLPYCERGNNGGRVMWFPPYDLKISENNSARWETNVFLGRPEPIYTYQNTERSGQLSFKIVVDHPSILNLLVREHFKGMSDEESDNYINAFFAGCEDIDFYALIRKYTTLDGDDVQKIKDYLDKGTDPQIIKKYKTVVDPPVVGEPIPSTTTEVKVTGLVLNYENDFPKGGGLISTKTYTDEYYVFKTKKSTYIDGLTTDIITLISAPSVNSNVQNDKRNLVNNDTNLSPSIIPDTVAKITSYFDNLEKSFNDFTKGTDELKKQLSGNTVQDITLNVGSSCSSLAPTFYNEKLSLRRSHSVVLDFFKRISKDPNKIPDLKWIKDNELVNLYNKNGKSVSAEGGVELKIEYNLSDFGWTENKGKLTLISNNSGETYRGSSFSTDCLDKDFKYVKGLQIHAPIAFYCRKSSVDFTYHVSDNPPQPTQAPGRTRIEEDGVITIPGKSKKPPIDVMKRIIMKTLSECHYFKKLEEDSPLAFKSLKEKLKYFHPGFHSTTPEGLNSRLTFLHQCIRPGDTIPIKGVADKNDLDARNASFGPPPICVLRIGDFYHSKIAIKDVNISYDDGVWDLNPEGIGVQPMIATVQMSLSFIGGQGLEKPVERLQNALSSNFYGNTEIYDERSISTNTKIDGKDAEVFTKSFLEDLLKDSQKTPDNLPPDGTNKVSQDTYIGGSAPNLDYDKLVNGVFSGTTEYFKAYPDAYNTIQKKYGDKINSIFFDPKYRTIKDYDVYTSFSNSPGKTIQLFGLYESTGGWTILIKGVKATMVANSESIDLCSLFKFDKEMGDPKIKKANELLQPYVKTFIETKMDEILSLNPTESFEKKRNDLIVSLDNVNMVVKYEHDFKIKGEVTTKATLSGFTSNLLYDQYKKCIEYISENTIKFYSHLDDTYNFNSTSMPLDVFTEILGILFKDQIDRDKLMKEVFETDTTIFNDRLRKNLRKRLDDFSIIPDEVKKWHFKKEPVRSNNKPLKFIISKEEEETDENTKKDITKVFSDSVSVTNKLNFYKTKTK